MRTPTLLRVTLALVVLLPALPAAAGPPPADGSALGKLAWLAGSWKRDSPRGDVYESWRILSDRTFEGESWRVLPGSGKRVHGEAMLLATMGSDTFLLPRPAENPAPVAFRLTFVDERVAVFENPEHDFPRTIRYQRNEGRSMTVSIEGPADGKTHKIDFDFERVD